MAIAYDVYSTPTPSQEDSKKYHVRVVSKSPKTEKELIKTINSRCTLTAADIKGVLTALSDVIKEEMLDGRRVHLHGIGYLYPIITSDAEGDGQKVRAPQIEIKSIAFRPERDMIKDLKDSAEFHTTKFKNHSSKHTAESIVKRLKEYLAKNKEIERADFQILCGLTRSTSQRWLKRLLEEGKIMKVGNMHAPRYVATSQL